MSYNNIVDGVCIEWRSTIVRHRRCRYYNWLRRHIAIGVLWVSRSRLCLYGFSSLGPKWSVYDASCHCYGRQHTTVGVVILCYSPCVCHARSSIHSRSLSLSLSVVRLVCMRHASLCYGLLPAAVHSSSSSHGTWKPSGGKCRTHCVYQTSDCQFSMKPNRSLCGSCYCRSKTKQNIYRYSVLRSSKIRKTGKFLLCVRRAFSACYYCFDFRKKKRVRLWAVAKYCSCFSKRRYIRRSHHNAGRTKTKNYTLTRFINGKINLLFFADSFFSWVVCLHTTTTTYFPQFSHKIYSRTDTDAEVVPVCVGFCVIQFRGCTRML